MNLHASVLGKPHLLVTRSPVSRVSKDYWTHIRSSALNISQVTTQLHYALRHKPHWAQHSCVALSLHSFWSATAKLHLHKPRAKPIIVNTARSRGWRRSQLGPSRTTTAEQYQLPSALLVQWKCIHSHLAIVVCA